MIRKLGILLASILLAWSILIISWPFLPKAIAGIIQAIIPAAVPTANKQGNSSLFQLSSGAVTNGHCGSFDGNGNIVDSGVACTGAGAGTPGSTFFSSTTQAGPSNTGTETSLIGSVAGSTTIAANTFTNGAYMLVEGQGFFSLPAVADSLTIKAKCGSTVLGSASFTPAAGVITNGTFRAWLGITAIGSGAGGAFNTNGGVDLYTGGPAPFESSKILNTSNVAFDFTTACAFNLTAQWGGSGQAGESITGSGVVAYVPGAPVTSVGGQTGAVAGEGNGTKVQMFTGSDPATGNFPKYDASHNLIDGGFPVGVVQLAPTVTTAGSATTVTFSSISGAFTNLCVNYNARTSVAVSTAGLRMEINSDTTAGNYTETQYILTSGTTVTANNDATSSTLGSFISNVPGSTAPANFSGSGMVCINAYSGTTFDKRFVHVGGYASSGVNNTTIQTTGVWKNTAAITSLIFQLDSSDAFVNGSQFTLYGKL